jgi:uncharacterized protein YhbP (UPF0306 family)
MSQAASFDWREHIQDGLLSTQYGCLGTVGPRGVWSNPVYFSWDEKLHFYFISLPDSLHMKNITANPNVSLALYSTQQDTHQPVRGIQLAGQARILDQVPEAKAAYPFYYGRLYPDTRRRPGDKHGNPYEDRPAWLFVCITPGEMYYFDERYFGDCREIVPLGSFTVDPPWVASKKK